MFYYWRKSIMSDRQTVVFSLWTIINNFFFLSFSHHHHNYWLLIDWKRGMNEKIIIFLKFKKFSFPLDYFDLFWIISLMNDECNLYYYTWIDKLHIDFFLFVCLFFFLVLFFFGHTTKKYEMYMDKLQMQQCSLRATMRKKNQNSIDFNNKRG